MCGIYGYVGEIKKGKEKIVYDLMTFLAIHTESRGKHSTGYVGYTEKEIILEKDPSRASIFVHKSKHMENLITKKGCRVFIGHNRYATHGPKDTLNAHPFMGEKFAMVHNGVCREAFKLAKRFGVFKKIKSECDTEAVLRLADKFGFTKRVFEKVSSYSVVALDLESKKVLFARDSERPMIIFDLREELGIRVFASEVEIFEYAAYDANVESEKISFFSTKPYHIYECDHTTGEVNNLGEYEPKVKPAPKPAPKPKIDAVAYEHHIYSDDGYFDPIDIRNTPPSNYSMGWSGGDKLKSKFNKALDKISMSKVVKRKKGSKKIIEVIK